MISADKSVLRSTDPAGRADWSVMKPVVLFHVITRAVVVAGLVAAAVASGRSFSAVVTRWDGHWYERLALHGYPAHLPVRPTGGIAPNTAGFFPLYPLLTKGLMALGIPFWLGGMLINLVASTAAVMIIVLVGLHYMNRRAAQLLACIWTASPLSAVLTTTYTEAIFTVFSAAALLFMFRRNWVLAGVAAALAGTVRPTGIVFAGAVALGALEAIIRRREWRSLVGAAIGPLGFLGAVGYIGLRARRLDAWTLTEHGGWHSRLDFGATWPHFLSSSSPYTLRGETHLLTGILAALLLLLAIATIAGRPPLPIIGLTVVGTFLALAFAGTERDSAPRVMMTFFPIFGSLAILMSRWPAAVRWTLLGAASVAAALIGAFYFAFAHISP